MNWLAHLLLAKPTPEGRLGNLLGDLVKGKAQESLSLELQQGIACHQAIDIFTDSHPIVRHSKQVIDPEYRRFAGILIDIFYDYILASNWQNYSSSHLPDFATSVYASWSGHLETLPIHTRGVIQRLIAEDWLTSYNSLSGIENTLARISCRLNRRGKRTYNLTFAISELTDNYSILEQDFQHFFPQLQLYIDNWQTHNDPSAKR